MKTINHTFLFCILAFSLQANNIQVSNVTLTGRNAAFNFTMVQFDLSWENSWRMSVGPSNWDAAWIFIKFRKNGGPWQHAQLNYNTGNAANDGHTQPSGSIIKTASDKTGCFMYRDANGSGNVNWTGIQLRWNYGQNGVADNDMIDIKVLAIEMVYIPQESFYLGVTDPTAAETDRLRRISNVQKAYLVNSENAIVVNSFSSSLYYDVLSGSNAGDQNGPIPAAFPKGYNAFYTMKYEVSEEQWLSFFNMLTIDQKTAYDITNASGKNNDGVVFRNTISYGSGKATTSAPARAMSYIGWFEMSGYLDWCALRPFTELEYEKMAKGPTLPKTGEFAWGNNLIHSSKYTLSQDGTESALITNPKQGTGNANYFDASPFSSLGPVRVGIFAASATVKNREETGASYYGVMELSGNMFERCISIGSSLNRAFTGLHGNGSIGSTSPYAHNVTGWPSSSSWGAQAYRGGSHLHNSSTLRVSDRTYSCVNFNLQEASTGIRGSRTAE